MRTGRVIEDQPGDANLGLAIDHALLLTYVGGVTLRLWRNPRSVIIGRGQSPSLEANEVYCHANGVIICRRISGGGAVYQDEGNLNISLIYPRSALERIDDVREATRLLPRIIMESLRRNGVDQLSTDSLNAIYKDGFKVSGAAAYLKSNVVLSHSTLLLSTDLKRLEKSLLHIEGVKRGSRYSPTTNLRLDVGAWRPILVSLISERFNTRLVETGLTQEEEHLAAHLRDAVYESDGWVSEGRMPKIRAPRRALFKSKRSQKLSE